MTGAARTLLPRLAARRVTTAEEMGVTTKHDAQPGTGVTVGGSAPGIDSILLLQGRDFAESACAAFLGRCARPEEAERINTRLESGDSKMNILCELHASDEARCERILPRGYRAASLRYRLARLPIAGAFFAALMRVEGDTRLDRRVRALQSRMHRQTREMGARIEAVREAIYAPGRARSDRSSGDGRALERQRALLRAEHAIDRKVWAIEQAEAQKYIASILDWARTSETYAKSLEQEVGRLRGVFDVESGKWSAARAEAMRRIEELEAQVAAARGPRS